MSTSRTAPLVVAFAASLASLLTPRAAAAQILTLSISPQQITFAPADPDTTPNILAPAISVSYRVRLNGGGNWQLTLLASGDLISSGAAIGITNVQWTATPSPPFQAGTLSHAVAQRLAGGSGNVNPAQTGSVVFSLANAWTYNVGVYSTTVNFTLVAP